MTVIDSDFKGYEKEFNFLKELKDHIITEQDMRDEFSKGAIEMSFTGEWVPLEVVEGKFDEFIKRYLEIMEANKMFVESEKITGEMILWVDVEYQLKTLAG